MLLVVTIAVRLPAVFGFVEMLTVSCVAVAAVTVPTAPLLNCTVLLPRVVASNPKPAMVIVAALAARFALLPVTTGLTVATCRAEPLVRLFVVTMAVRFPIVVGVVVNVTVIELAVAAVTVPIAPLLKAIVSFAGVSSNPRPTIVIDVALASNEAVLLVTIGETVAT